MQLLQHEDVADDLRLWLKYLVFNLDYLRGRVGSRGGSRQTRLASAAAPPRAPSVVLGFIGMVIVSAVVLIVLANLIGPIARLIPNAKQASLFQTFAPLAVLGVLVIIFFGWVIRHRAKKKRYVPRFAAWEQTWMCQKCGATWMRRRPSNVQTQQFIGPERRD